MFGISTLFPIGGIYVASLLYGNLTGAYDTPRITKNRIFNPVERRKYINSYKNTLISTTRNFSPLFMKITVFSILCSNILFYFQQKEFFALKEELSTFNKFEIDSLNDYPESEIPFNKKSIMSQIIPFKKNEGKPE